ncbi:helix-turn-helix domain-containing protein [Planosporangium flavigriseum]|uniref:Cupin n=1 Tax=Planosporangium flavigriseum TaxID=373681 RepID=A0A8J3PN96_9ACTN|nr:XRE family transcriptional regulator [Planosporangium flavigriseum]NJC66217.1 helix-turn-helix domain-containing protein [Planosporangium flavigriseum]GIG74673.1 cupin [Planosporangium flavigriseum]
MFTDSPSSATTAALPDGGEKSIGSRLRRRRLALRLTLKEVAAQADVAESFLSQLERGVHSGSVRTLQKISAALGLQVGALFQEGDRREPAVIRFHDSVGFTFGINVHKRALTGHHFDHLQAFLGEFDAYGSTGVEPYSHGDSEEIVLVIQGEVDLQVGSQTYRLGPLDSITYHSNEAHRIAEAAGDRAVVFWAMSPPSF